MRVIEVTAIKYDRLLQGALDSVKVGAAKFRPLGNDDKRIGAGEAIDADDIRPQRGN